MTTLANMQHPVVRIDKLWTVFGKGAAAFSVHQDLDLTVPRGLGQPQHLAQQHRFARA